MTNIERANQIRMLGNCLGALRKQAEVVSRVTFKTAGGLLRKEPPFDKRIQKYEDRIRQSKNK